jgi:hypothetical protein
VTVLSARDSQAINSPAIDSGIRVIKDIHLKRSSLQRRDEAAGLNVLWIKPGHESKQNE